MGQNKKDLANRITEKISKQIPSSKNINHYRIYKKRLQKLLNLAEKEYYHDLFEAHKGNLKKSWDIIKGIINKKQSSSNSSEFIINGQKTSDKEHIANAFNRYFTNVGKSFNDKLPPI